MSDITVVIRARDEAAGIGRCLELLAAQRVEGKLETIVVDNGSRDATPEIVRRHGARLIEIPRAPFSFGGALNVGAAEARGELLVALSAHAYPPDADWLARLAGVFVNPGVACACGDQRGPDDLPLHAPVEQDLALARRYPHWGYSNGAGAFRAELWRQRPFREDLPGCEDKEWAWHWLQAGWICVIDPMLAVDHEHTRDSLAGTYLRARREAAGLAAFLEESRFGARELVQEWWSERGWHRSSLRARLSPRRAARLLGKYAGYH